jgi:nitroreductase
MVLLFCKTSGMLGSRMKVKVRIMTGHLGNLIERPHESLRLDSSPLQTLINDRRAIKFFSKQHAIDQRLLDEIITTASMAPSAFNLQHWKILQIKDKSIRKKIAECSWHQPQICDSSELLIVLLDKFAWQRNDRLASNIACEETRKKYFATLKNLYEQDVALSRDEAMRSCSMFAMLLMLIAQERGIETCPMTGCDLSLIHI